jgi:hypothetical protein
LASEASETSFVKDEFDLMVSQSHIALLSCSGIMDLHALFLTRWAGCLGGGGDYLNPNRAIRSPFLLENMQLGQIQWHENTFSSDRFFCGMLAWQGLFSLIWMFLCLPSSTKDKPFLLFFLPVFL